MSLMNTELIAQILRALEVVPLDPHVVIALLEQLNSVEELDAVGIKLVQTELRGLIGYYRESFLLWKDPQFPPNFVERCPLLSARLDTSPKIRILLRGAAYFAVEPMIVGGILEEIIRHHDVDGKQFVVFPDCYIPSPVSGSAKNRAFQVVYTPSFEARSLFNLAIPGCTRSGFDSRRGAYIDWRSREEIRAAGDAV